ncbi:hypothetical protein Clacol_004958 [Clathrus columnatus]|uniref:Uncharacterized protein n=1 Tax=Clathrus columnatus TaxID=1419009 RepID=A0AAV5AE09_9AGAM|nr:hypothetical protein Clacol_004958 [Clathrus columnatus]
MNVDFEKKPFSDKNADLKVYFGSNCVRGDGTYIGDLQPDPNQLLCAYYPGQVAREFIRVEKTKLEAEKKILRGEDEPTKNSSSSSKKKEKGRVDIEQDLSRRLEQLAAELNVRALHRRVMLDDIRKALVAQGVIQDDIKPTQNSNALTRIVSLVKEGLRKQGLRMLSDPAIMAIFDTNETTLRGIGNDVAHKASTKDIAEAVLDSGLSETDRKKATELFMWLNGRNPALQNTA